MKPPKIIHFIKPSIESSVHGRAHWDRVHQNGMVISRMESGVDPRIVTLFAYLHDRRRENDHTDPGHGARAVKLHEFLQHYVLPGSFPEWGLNVADKDKLHVALRRHDEGLLSLDATIGACWDADRLDLIRVGIVPDPSLMSTDTGKMLAEKLQERYKK